MQNAKYETENRKRETAIAICKSKMRKANGAGVHCFLFPIYKKKGGSFEPPFFYLFIICFASILSVACGTALSRALSMSLPVTRQIP